MTQIIYQLLLSVSSASSVFPNTFLFADYSPPSADNTVPAGRAGLILIIVITSQSMRYAYKFLCTDFYGDHNVFIFNIL